MGHSRFAQLVGFSRLTFPLWEPRWVFIGYTSPNFVDSSHFLLSDEHRIPKMLMALPMSVKLLVGDGFTESSGFFFYHTSVGS